MGFQIVGVFLGAYMSPFNPEHSYFLPISLQKLGLVLLYLLPTL